MSHSISLEPIDYSSAQIKEIVELIRKNLDPDFSEEFFKWKHLENSFGKSYGLLAIDNGKIVGLRMFMRWEFFSETTQKTFRAIRPVDTVVDKSYRGQGLFSRLTLSGIKDCEGEFDLIFNTPNQNSLPGYLKMGWQEMQNAPSIRLGLINPFNTSNNYKVVSKGEYAACGCNYEKTTTTNLESGYLDWRYISDRNVMFTNENASIIYSIEKRKGVKIVIVFEALGDSTEFSKLLGSISKYENAYFCLYSVNIQQLKPLFSIEKKKSTVVFKDDDKNVINNTRLTLGDLEGIL
ncbi:GNAT family N-acetyltransferase [Christiangramia sp. SM2212]|uniref:GNAT family N-acetyltransferase n=1 Tax=Christiangramia sediminicola TaxID=3073267 RepID=A0ABU1EQA4_9FLAO|nr:GNAT family N-acetyltransferase [Christiangramia sp. SM2212]MDR5590572.1 GNAT family N-acetyltransferase [Christiangramia sp. SM2212]